MILITVFGKAEPAGSKKGFAVKSKEGGKVRAIVTDANSKSKPWKQEVAGAAREVYKGPLLDTYLTVTFVFYRPRPKGHFGSSGNLNAKGRREFAPGSKPDLLKLARGAEDALTGIIYRDDALICEENLRKYWGEPARLEIRIEEMGGPLSLD